MRLQPRHSGKWPLSTHRLPAFLSLQAERYCRTAATTSAQAGRASVAIRIVAATDAKIARGEDVALPAAVWAAIESGEHPIRAIRKYRGLTQIDVAEQAGLRQGYIADIEAGKKTGSATSLKAIAAALGVPLDVIVG